MYCRVLLGITAVLLCYLTIFQREVGGMYSRYYMFLCIFLAICVAKIFFRVHIIKCLLDIILYFESIYFLDIFLGYIGQALLGTGEFVDYIQFQLNPERIFILTISRVVLVSILLFLKHYKVLVSRLFSKYQFIFVGFAFLEYVGLFFCEQVFIPAFRIEGKIYIYFALFPIILVLSLIIVIVYFMYIEKRNEMVLVNKQNSMIEKNYQEMILLYQKKDQIFHDMKNHLSVLSLLISDRNFDRAEEYIKKISEPILELEHKKFTGNRIVDIILNDKLEKAESNNIELVIDAKEVKEGTIQDIDWCAILSNILDNAIEACQKIKGKERRIEIVIKQNDCATLIDVTNTYNGEVKIIDNHLKSDKKDNVLHGIGIESVRTAVEKYNGVFEYTWCKDIFKVNISLFN